MGNIENKGEIGNVYRRYTQKIVNTCEQVWAELENRGKAGRKYGLSEGNQVIHRKKICEFTFHRTQREEKKGGKDFVKRRSIGSNPVKNRE